MLICFVPLTCDDIVKNMSSNTKGKLICYLAVLKLYENDDCRCITHLDSTQIKKISN